MTNDSKNLKKYIFITTFLEYLPYFPGIILIGKLYIYKGGFFP